MLYFYSSKPIFCYHYYLDQLMLLQPVSILLYFIDISTNDDNV